jgi:hypothetical protein
VSVLVDVAQPRDRSGRPLRPEVGPPGCPPLRDRDGVPVDDRLDADLVERVRRDSLLAVGADRGDVDRRRAGHRAKSNQNRELSCSSSGLAVTAKIESIRSASSVSGRACR